MSYSQFSAVLSQIAGHLRRIERNSNCDSCKGVIQVPSTGFAVTPAVTTAFLSINGIRVGTGVVAAYATISALVTALNAAYTGIAVFTLNPDNTIVVTSNNPGNLDLSVTSV